MPRPASLPLPLPLVRLPGYTKIYKLGTATTATAQEAAPPPWSSSQIPSSGSGSGSGSSSSPHADNSSSHTSADSGTRATAGYDQAPGPGGKPQTLGTAPKDGSLLRFGAQGLTIPREGNSGWAVVGDAEGRKLVVETLLSRHRILPAPPSPGSFPFISSLLSSSASASSSTTITGPGTSYNSSVDTPDTVTPVRPVRHLAFAKPPPSTGEFTDFTARYGALQESDKLSFRQTLSALDPSPSAREIEKVAGRMRISHLLDLPGVSLSSGQTRRGRIAAALLTKPVLLLLEEPMAGLDVDSREEVGRVLGELNDGGEIRIVLVLRGKGKGKEKGKSKAELPGWVTNVVDVREGEVWVGSKNEWAERQNAGTGDLDNRGGKLEELAEVQDGHVSSSDTSAARPSGPPIVQLTDVSVSYGEGTRKVLDAVSWTINPGDRWHLQGANGSGKTTLLSLILGHHPRSFSLPASSLQLFSKPRRETPTTTLRSLIGHTSPEIFAAFPRGMGLSALDTVGTGFEGVFARRTLSQEQKKRVLGLMEYFKPFLATGRLARPVSTSTAVTVEELAKRQFSHFTPAQQSLLLFLRAIVSRPKLLILDEPSQGVDEAIWARCVELLDKERKENPDQAVVVVSHYEDEVPWTGGKVYKLVDGKGVAS